MTSFSRMLLGVLALLLCCVGTRLEAQVNAYTFAASSGTFTPNSGGTDVNTIEADDVLSATITLPFTFTFNGVAYTSCKVSSNGWLGLGTGASGSQSSNSLTSGSGRPVLAPLWDDMHGATTGQATYVTTGTSPNQVFTMEWLNWRWNYQSTAAVISFQVKLYEGTNVVEFVYRQESGAVNTASGGASIGITAVATGSGNFLSLNNSSASPTVSSTTETSNITTKPATGQVYTFTPPPPCTGTPTPGTIPSSVSVCAGSNGTVTLTATGFTTGVTGISLQWEESLDNSTWNNVTGGTGATTSTYTSPAVTGTIYYRCKVTCVPSGGMATTNACTVSVVGCSYDAAKNTASFSSISGSGSSMSGWRNGNNTDDNLSTAQPIGFTFNYKGNNYTQFLASTNGFMTFNVGTSAVGSGAGAYGFDNSAFSSATGSLLSLAPFYEDLVCQGNPATAAGLTNAIKYLTTGTAPNRVLTIEWVNMETYLNAGPNLNFQVKLYETTNVVEFVYGTMEGFNGTTNFNYTYSMGINGAAVSELFSQQIENVQAFSNTVANSLVRMVECNTMYTFTPGTYSGAQSGPGAPSNDESAGATTLTVNETPCIALCGTYYTSKNATQSAGTTACSAATPGTADDDVWFKFTANNSTQTITVRSGGGYNSVVQLLDNAFVPVACVNATGSGLTETINATGLTTGALYYIRVYHSGTGSNDSPGTGDFSICVNGVAPPPANDNICGAVTLTANSTCTNTAGNTVTATASPQTACGGTPDDDVWFKWVAVTGNDVVTVTSGTGFNAHLQIFSAVANNCDSALTSLACVNSTSTGGTETYTGSNLTPGNTYFARVYHSASGFGGGTFNICVTIVAPACPSLTAPANAASVEATTGTTLTWSASSGATGYDVYFGTTTPPTTLVSSNQPGLTYATGALTPGQTYYWQILARNSAGASTGCTIRNFNTNPPACIASPTAPSNGGSVCDNAATTLSWPSSAGATGYDVYLNTGATATTLVSSNQAGTTYAAGNLAAGSYAWKIVPRNANGAASGCADWTFTSIAGPTSGDNQANATVITTTPFTETVNTANCYQNDYASPMPNARTTADAYWVITTAPCTDSLEVGTCGTGFDTYLHLLDATGAHIVSNDDDGPLCSGTAASLRVAVTGNTTYYIVAEGFSANGAITLSVMEQASGTGAPVNWYTDADADGYGTAPFIIVCDGSMPTGYATNDDDCDDADNAINPGATDVCGNGIDENCDGMDAGIQSFEAVLTPNCVNAAKNRVDIANVIGGTPSYTYSKDGGTTYQTSAIFMNLPAGTYTFVVKDAGNCTLTQTVVINPPMTLTTDGDVIQCFGDSTATVSVSVSGGYPDYTYIWKKGTVVVGTEATVSDLPAGTYKVTVTDDRNCIKVSGSVFVLGPPKLNLKLTAEEVSCNGAMDGGVAATVSGGTLPYSYSWSNGSTASGLVNVSGGTYFLTLSDANGCTKVEDALVKEYPALGLTISKKDVACFGVPTGEITARATGGKNPRTYHWSTGAVTTTNKLIGLAPGTYSVTVKDANLCQIVSGPVVITGPASAINITSITSVPTSTTHKVTVVASGGTPTYKYRRTLSPGVWGPFTATGIFTNVPAGTYDFEAQDSKKCSDIDAGINIPVSPRPAGSRGEMGTANNFELLPNPARSSVQVAFNGTAPISGDIEVRDAKGSLVQRINVAALTASNNRIALDNLTSGVLFVTYRADDGTTTTKRLVVIE